MGENAIPLESTKKFRYNLDLVQFKKKLSNVSS